MQITTGISWNYEDVILSLECAYISTKDDNRYKDMNVNTYATILQYIPSNELQYQVYYSTLITLIYSTTSPLKSCSTVMGKTDYSITYTQYINDIPDVDIVGGGGIAVVSFALPQYTRIVQYSIQYLYSIYTENLH